MNGRPRKKSARRRLARARSLALIGCAVRDAMNLEFGRAACTPLNSIGAFLTKDSKGPEILWPSIEIKRRAKILLKR